jgi:hypothetical protein
MQEDILIPLAAFTMIVAWVGFVQIGSTIRHYLDWRLRMAERQVGSSEAGVLPAIQELRAEIAALKRNESDAVLSFDSTLQRLESRLAHLERRSLGAPEEQPVPLAARAGRGADELR